MGGGGGETIDPCPITYRSNKHRFSDDVFFFYREQSLRYTYVPHDLFDRDLIYLSPPPPLFTRSEYAAYITSSVHAPNGESIIRVHRLHVRYRFNYCYYVVINYHSVGSPGPTTSIYIYICVPAVLQADYPVDVASVRR